MGQKKIKHHAQTSQFTHLKDRLGGLFKEIVQEPMEHDFSTPKEEALSVEQDEPLPSLIEEDDCDEETEHAKRREERSNEIREEILSNLNRATQRWKETGDIGIKIEPPVPLRDRVKTLWSKMKVGKDMVLQSRLKARIEEVVRSAARRIKEARTKRTPLDEEEIIREEWQDVLTKMEPASTPTERDEIETIYEQLAAPATHKNDTTNIKPDESCHDNAAEKAAMDNQ